MQYTPTPDPLVAALWREKDKRQLSRAGLAELFGCSDRLLALLRTGERRLGADLLSAIVVHFPELEPDVLMHLRERDRVALGRRTAA